VRAKECAVVRAPVMALEPANCAACSNVVVEHLQFRGDRVSGKKG